MKILVTGGAGYIGSHCLRHIEAAGHQAVVIDSLVNGHRHVVPSTIPFYPTDIGDREQVERILKEEGIDAVMHFAAFVRVDESVRDPLKYYENNAAKTLSLLQAVAAAGVQRFVFSSTCAIFGQPEKLPIREDTPKAPINPYGESKWMVEKMLQAMATAGLLSFASLRYFNAAGAREDGTLGDFREEDFHLIPIAIKSALKQRPPLTIFGKDYPTPDGTCQRDYIHVDDLSQAHIAALAHLDQPGKALYYNLGTGQPHSVLDVVTAIETVSGCTVPTIQGERREGDPAILYAGKGLAQKELNWKLSYPDLESIIATSWNWYRSRANF